MAKGRGFNINFAFYKCPVDYFSWSTCHCLNFPVSSTLQIALGFSGEFSLQPFDWEQHVKDELKLFK
jgi:hypothetical protein